MERFFFKSTKISGWLFTLNFIYKSTTKIRFARLLFSVYSRTSPTVSDVICNLLGLIQGLGSKKIWKDTNCTEMKHDTMITFDSTKKHNYGGF